jgi:hypothetical protein
MVNDVPQRIEVVFYRSISGNEPLREWLIDLPEVNRRAVGQDLQRVQYRWPVGMPLVRPMGKGLFEVRTPLPDGTSAVLLSQRRNLCAARLHQEGPEDTGAGPANGPQTPEGG